MCHLNTVAVHVILRWRQGFRGKEKLGRGGGVQEGKEEYCREEERVKHRTRVWRKDSILSCLYELGTRAWRKIKKNLAIKVRASGAESLRTDKCSLV